MNEAQLNYQLQRGYYGLLVEPSYNEMLRSLKKKIRIPQPDRSAKWYALGPFRAFLLDQAKRFNDAQREDLEYDDTGAHLPAAVIRAQRGSMAGTDDTWNRQEQFAENLRDDEARKLAEAAMAAEQKQQANQMRRLQLSSYGPTSGHWTVEAHHADLEYTGVPHAAPMPKLAMPAGKWQSPPNEFESAGHPQAAEFPTYEQLNMGQDARFKLGRPASLNVSGNNYQQLRQNYLT